jgi:hypothetical protein
VDGADHCGRVLPSVPLGLEEEGALRRVRFTDLRAQKVKDINTMRSGIPSAPHFSLPKMVETLIFSGTLLYSYK